MAIPFLSDIEKLINEHGSAAILKERLALAADQFSALEKKYSDADLRVKELTEANANLRSSLSSAEEKLKALELKQPRSQDIRIDEMKEGLLQILAKHSNVTSNQLAGALQKGEQLITFHLTDMEKAGLVHGSYFAGGDTEWSIAQPGRAYLFKHSLLS